MKKLMTVAAGMGMMLMGFSAQADVRLQGGGATFPDPVYKLWIQKYKEAHPDVTIDYQAQGSGFGIKSITAHAIDFAGSDAPMNKAEIDAAGGAAALIEVPTVAGAVVAAYNLPGLSADLKLDGPVLADIYLGKITKWNDARIAALNEGVALPDMPITTVHRADASGTNFVFTKYLATQSEEFNKKPGSGKSVEWPTGTGSQGNAGVAQVVTQTPGSIGYLELAYALNNKIAFADMKNKDGKFVKATPESVSLAGEGAVANLKGDLLVANIWNQAGEKSYPISAFTYIIVYKDLGTLKDPAKAKVLVDFLTWATTEGEKLAPELHYAPLSESVQKKVQEAISHLTLEGKPVGK